MERQAAVCLYGSRFFKRVREDVLGHNNESALMGAQDEIWTNLSPKTQQPFCTFLRCCFCRVVEEKHRVGVEGIVVCLLSKVNSE